MVTYADHMAYMNNLGTWHKMINSVVHGDYEEIMDIMNTDIEYPCLWIETPDMKVGGDNDYHYPQFTGNAVVLYKADPHNKKSVKYAKEQSYRMAVDILNKMAEDQGHLFDISRNDINALPPLTADYLVGWRINYIKAYEEDPICYDENQFNIPKVNSVIFSAVRSSSTNVTVTATIISKPVGASLSWRYIIDDNDPVDAGSADSIIIFDVGSSVYIEVKSVTTGLPDAYASLYIGPYVITLQSIPYAFHPIIDR